MVNVLWGEAIKEAWDEVDHCTDSKPVDSMPNRAEMATKLGWGWPE